MTVNSGNVDDPKIIYNNITNATMDYCICPSV